MNPALPMKGINYLRARFYNPVIGRFIQEDTYYGDGLNLYAYCHNNPVGYVDPSGHVCTDKQQAIHILEENGDPRKAKKEYNKLRKQYSSATELREALEKKYGKSRFTDTYELRPNNKYTINGYTYVTDELGRIISARGDLRLENGKRFGNHQSKAGGIFRLKTDDGGHLFATIFGGSGKIDNIVPMDSNLNRGRYKALENKWAGILKDNPNAKISVSITNIYSGNSARPTGIKVKYSIDGVMQDTETFMNRKGGK